MGSIKLEHINKTYGKDVIIPDLNLEIEDGSFTVLVGPSGCGKSTTLRMIAGLETPSSGRIFIDDTDIGVLPPGKRDIAMVFQNYALYPTMTVRQNIEFGLENKKIPKEERRKLVEEISETVGLTPYLDRKPSKLSGGQRQRVALARAMVKKPKVFLMDEPLSNLDAKLRTQMRVELIQMHERLKTTFVYVTHDQVEAMTMSDRVFVINRGVVQQVGSPMEIYRRPKNQFIADFVGKVNFIKGQVNGSAVDLKGIGQSLAYEGPLTGDVVVAIRPENIKLTKAEGHLHGAIKSMFYLGDVNDCQIDISGTQLRVIADPHTYDVLRTGEEIGLEITDFLVYEDDGRDDHNQILT